MTGVGSIEQARVIRRDGVGQAVAIALEPGPLVVREVQHALERLESAQRVTHLPAPIVPAAIVGLGKKLLAEGPSLPADRESRDPDFRGIGGYGCLHM